MTSVPVEETMAVPATPPTESTIQADLEATSRLALELDNVGVTPPPSSQIPRAQFEEDTQSAKLLSTPTTGRRNASKDLPTSQHIEQADAEQLRSMVKHLANDLADARISTANAHLQHHFLLLETSQAAERAEIEHQLSRTQVEYLRVKQQPSPSKRAMTSAAAVQPPSHIETTRTMRDLEYHCEALEELCERLKREKESQAERIQSLSEHNSLLVNRIRENREHASRAREQLPPLYTPREAYTTPRKRGYSRYQDDTPTHGPFAALIAADQLLSQESASVPSTPSKRQQQRAKTGHTRGTHSLSSIQTPQNRDRLNASDPFLSSQLLLSAPASQLVNESAERERHDRDSTISVSDDGNGELNQPQASSLATDMLRRNPSAFESLRGSQDAEKTSNLLQSKLFGNVSKSSKDTSPNKLKRQYGIKDSSSKSKKMRREDQIGLGIEA